MAELNARGVSSWILATGAALSLAACSDSNSNGGSTPRAARTPQQVPDDARRLAALWLDLLSDGAPQREAALLRLLEQPQLAQVPFTGVFIAVNDGDSAIDANGVLLDAGETFGSGFSGLALETIPSITKTSGALGELDHASKVRLLGLIDDLAQSRRRWAFALTDADVDRDISVYQVFGLVSLQYTQCGRLELTRRLSVESLAGLASGESEQSMAAERARVFAEDRKADAELRRQSFQKWDEVAGEIKANSLPR